MLCKKLRKYIAVREPPLYDRFGDLVVEVRNFLDGFSTRIVVQEPYDVLSISRVLKEHCHVIVLDNYIGNSDFARFEHAFGGTIDISVSTSFSIFKLLPFLLYFLFRKVVAFSKIHRDR